MLVVDVEKRFSAFSLAVRFETAHRVTALFGPSGSGKTTLVNMIAGLVTPDRGRIVFDGSVLFDSAARIAIRPHRRRIGYVFQDGRLFPHFSVRGNLEYGRRMCRLPRDPQHFERIVALLDLHRLIGRRPRYLSGGERQRVAIGRALMMKPRLLLLDEPFASLDAARKAEILPYLERLRDESGVPMIYVSHNPDDVRRIASEVVRLEAGAVTAIGGPDILS